MESITFDTANNILTVTLTDGTVKDYTDRASYLADWPERAADADAMGWV